MIIILAKRASVLPFYFILFYFMESGIPMSELFF